MPERTAGHLYRVPDPLTGIGSLALPGTATSSTTTPPTASTASLEPAVGTTGWSSGVYTIMASYAGSTTGTSECATTSTVASLAVTSPGQFSFGGGWYTPSTSVGQTSFGFVVAQDPKSTYSGTLNVVTPGKWWYQANVNSFGLITKTQGLLAGTGSLYWWEFDSQQGPRGLAARQIERDLRRHGQRGHKDNPRLVRPQHRLHAELGATRTAQLGADRPEPGRHLHRLIHNADTEGRLLSLPTGLRRQNDNFRLCDDRPAELSVRAPTERRGSSDVG